jgi:chaperonin GroEL
MKDALVLLVDHKISSARALLPILEQVSRENRSLFIISADGLESEVLTMLVLNKLNGLKVCAVKAPGFGDNRTAMLQDMAVLTGAEIVSQDLGHKLEEVKLKHLGKAAQITATQDHTIILGGGGAKDDINERCALLREKLKQPELSSYEKEKVQERLAKLLGGVAVIKVGGASEFEVGEKKDRVDDALNATMAAIDEGIVAGGGAALLYASRALESLKGENFDQDVRRPCFCLPLCALLLPFFFLE